MAHNFAAQNLPDGYTHVEYIESSGTQYIDTGFKPNQNTRVVCSGILEVSSSTNWLFGARNSSSAGQFFFAAGAAGYYLSGYNTEQNSYPTSMNSTNRIVVDKNKNVTTLTSNDTSSAATHAAATFSVNYNMLLFAVNTAGAVSYGKARIYSCQIYDNGTLVRDYVPAVKADGTVGLYENVNGTFYANAGTGVFARGAESGSVARLFYSAGAFGGYTGAFTVSQVTKDGVLYDLYTITSSGTLTLNEAAQAWICGGGGNGGPSPQANVGAGGAGGYVKSGNLSAGTHVVTIGSVSGATKIGSALTANGGASAKEYNSANGGSGGGPGAMGVTQSRTPGTGAGVSTYPFGITSLYAHCGGGGGGAFCYQNYSGEYWGRAGGAGGTNGGNGSAGTYVAETSPTSSVSGGAGGSRGGGRGGSTTTGKGANATFYGSGGGGAGYGYYMSGTTEVWFTNRVGGSGYQGVAYILIPA